MDNYKTMEINPNLEVYPLLSRASVSFPAIHFALWTHPKRIYLVGCDCNSAPYWDAKSRDKEYLVRADEITEIMLDGYKDLKQFADTCYPDVEIVSINPVGLKGIFKDLFQGEV